MASSNNPMTSEEEGAQVHWALPAIEGVAPARLLLRLDLYEDLLLLSEYDGRKRAKTVRMVSALEVLRVFTAEGRIGSGILPAGAFWWGTARGRDTVALWRDPQVWRIALQREAFKPAVRYRLPMPGLIFLCSAGQPPAVFAALGRPRSMQDTVYHAPVFNVFTSGVSCAGTHVYPDKLDQVPEEFFLSLFTLVEGRGRSKKHQELLDLWEELNGQKAYPVEDLVPHGPLERALGGLWR